MTMTTHKGAGVYLSAGELVALEHATALLSSLLEAASDPSPELPTSITALHGIIAKAHTSQRQAHNRDTLRRAIRASTP